MKDLDSARTVAVVNKSDLPQRLDTQLLSSLFSHVVFVSAASGDGLPELEQEVSGLLGAGDFSPGEGSLFTGRQRDEVKNALHAVREAEAALTGGLTLDAVTVCVEGALSALYSLTGEKASDEIVDRVFEEFCVGK